MAQKIPEAFGAGTPSFCGSVAQKLGSFGINSSQALTEGTYPIDLEDGSVGGRILFWLLGRKLFWDVTKCSEIAAKCDKGQLGGYPCP